MKTNVIALRNWCVLVICLTTPLHAANEADNRETQLARSKMEEVKLAYGQYQQAVVDLLSATERAAHANPDFGPGVTGLMRVTMMRDHPLPGAKEARRFRRDDPDSWKSHFQMCEGYAIKVMGDHLRDPNLAKQLKPALLLQYRAGTGWYPERRKAFVDDLANGSYAVFDPNDNNDERLWQNIKQNQLLRAEKAVPYRNRLVEDQGVPVWMMQYASHYRFLDGMSEWLRYWLAMEMPDEVLEAAKQLDIARESLEDVYPKWGQIEHIFNDNGNAEYGRATYDAARQIDTIIESINKMYPPDSRINPGSTDASSHHRKVGHVVDLLMNMFLEAGEIRPTRKVRKQYQQRRFVVLPEGRP